MDFEILVALLLTVAPITELRLGLPIVVNYCLKNNISVWPYFSFVVILNILVIFILFFFFDFLHERFLRIKTYKRLFSEYIEKTRQKQEKFERKFHQIGYLALVIFVAIPLPGTGAWTGTFLAWLFGLERKKSILAISLGVLIAGVIVLMASYGIFSFFSFNQTF
ncbi:MAG: small multi-drug export protein [Candidatus Pacearchaeota archaeon]